MTVSCNYSESPYTSSIYSTASALSAAVGFVSLLASCFTIFFILLFKQYKFFNQRLVLYLAVTAAIFSVSVIIQRVDYRQETGAFYTNFCTFSGFLNQVSSWMILDAVTSITLSLITRAFFKRDLASLDWLFVLFIFLFPFTFNWIPFIKMAYGKSGPWCWIRSFNEIRSLDDESTFEGFQFGHLLQLFLWYIPLYVIILVQIVLFALATIKLLRYKQYSMMDGYVPYNENDSQEMIKQTVPMLAYPVIYFVINIFPLINRIQIFVDPCHHSPALWFISGISFALMGVLIALAYSLNPQNRKILNRANFKVALVNLYMHRRLSAYDYNIPDENVSDSLRQGQLNNSNPLSKKNGATAHMHKALGTQILESKAEIWATA